MLSGACLGLGPWLGLLSGQGLTKVVGVETLLRVAGVGYFVVVSLLWMSKLVLRVKSGLPRL